MRIFHISDLHIGKQLYLYSLIEEQKAVLAQIVKKIDEYRPDVLLIAGDIFDKSVPSAEAYTVFDNFLNDLTSLEHSFEILIIAGNHDSAERLNYAGTFLEKHRIHIGALPPRTGEEYLKKVTLQDAWGEVNFYLLPFTKPAHVRRMMEEDAFGRNRAQGDESVSESGQVSSVTYDQAVRWLIDREKIDCSKRNVLLAHQFFVSGDEKPDTCDSEQLYLAVGGTDSVDISAAEAFDYAALGHLHGSQHVGKEHIRYSGSPLKYSVSEDKHVKGITMITLKEKAAKPEIQKIPLQAQKEVRSLKGTLKEVLALSTQENRSDYVSITLTDEEELFYPRTQLAEKYDNILEVRIDNRRTRAGFEEGESEEALLSPMEAFKAFYQEMQGTAMNETEEKLMESIIALVTEDRGE